MAPLMSELRVFVPAPLPPDESERLAALGAYCIMDSQDEPQFDHLTQLGAYAFGAPICLITFIAEHKQFFKSAYGAPFREALRQDSFCAFTLLQDEPLVVLNTVQDARFASNPHVQSPNPLLFYAGAPLVSREGFKVGTFCIFDWAPRESFSEKDCEALVRFASLTMQMVEQRLLPMQVARAEADTLKEAQNVRQILESVEDSVFLLDKDWNLTFLNHNAVKKNAQGRDVLGQNIWEMFPGLVGSVFEQKYRQAAEEGVAVFFEEYYPRLKRHFKGHVHPSGNGVVVFLSDVTEQRSLELELRKVEERYRLAARSTTEGVWDWDSATDEVYYSARWQEILGLPAVDVLGKRSDWGDRVHPKDLPLMQERQQEIEQQNTTEFRSEYRMRHESRGWIWVRNEGIVLRDAQNRPVRMVGSMKEITAEKSIEPLTGLPNRASALEKIEHRMELTSEKEKTFAVLVVGLDVFKRINDSFGRTSGDAVLIEIARRLESTIDEDPASIVGRVTGDEFVILLNGIAGVQDALAYAKRLQHVLNSPIEYQSQFLSVSAGIGIAMGDEGYYSAETILEDADVAMHQAKKAGKAQCVLFGSHMREQTRRRVELETDLRGALERNEFVLHYQPKVLLKSGALIGFEALVRWDHPVRGMISPAEFIPHAEEAGFIIDIGQWTLRNAIRQAKEWRTSGLTAPDITMAVNLSTRQFEKPGLISDIASALEEEDFPAHCLTLEVTESALMDNMAGAKKSLEGLRDLGVRLDLDDFGTGYSSLSYLNRLPFDSLKIDQSFIRELQKSQESKAIAESILQLGRTLNMMVIAEGIETVQQSMLLIQLGCLYGQGYLYSRPLPAEGIRALLTAPPGVGLQSHLQATDSGIHLATEEQAG
jgi:diguanylate cyclase (GGDEF)-like protein/PAS domain S-box-containing protein